MAIDVKFLYLMLLDIRILFSVLVDDIKRSGLNMIETIGHLE
jgi:hypothetical protein